MRTLSHYWKNISISKRLFIILGTMALLITLELLVLWASINALIAVRALVAGESLWSKAQKNSVIILLEYQRTADPNLFNAFEEQIKVIKGDQRARIALLKEEPDYTTAAQGLLEGLTHPDDVKPQMNFLVRFQNEAHVAKSIRVWEEGDVLIDELVQLAEELREKITSQQPQAEVEKTLSRIYALNEELSVLENRFANSLGDGARWMEQVLMWILLLAVICVESTGITITVFLSRYLTRSLRELNAAADRIGQGDYSITVPVESKDELGRLAWSLNKMSQDLEVSIGRRLQAEQSSRTKSQFLANMSHEIRTPLNAILGFTELLKDEKLPSSERQKYLGIIERTGENLSSLINDILDLSKVEAGHMDLIKKEFSLTALIIEVRDIIESIAAKKNLQVVFEVSPSLPQTIYSDPLRLRQILMNLLNNAVKFTENGFIKLVCEREGNKLIFTVQDTGIGIKANEREVLFKPFSQIDSSLSRKHDGTGLGLILSRRLAELMGGSVTLKESSNNQGSTFVATISLDNQQEHVFRPQIKAENKSEVNDGEKLKGLNVLLVDDVEDNLLLIEHFLKKFDMKIDKASNGLDAIQKISQHRYDLIIMDIQMPVMDGHTATKKLRSEGYTMPIIALTAHAMKEDKDRSLEAGCNDYLTKPIKPNVLVDTLVKYVKADVTSPS